MLVFSRGINIEVKMSSDDSGRCVTYDFCRACMIGVTDNGIPRSDATIEVQDVSSMWFLSMAPKLPSHRF